MRTLGLSFYESLFAKVGDYREVKETTWAGRVRAPATYASKECVPRFGAFRSADGRRRDTDVLEVTALVFDFDEGATPDLIEAAFGDFYGFAHTTWTAGRWRPLIIPDRPMTPTEFPRVWRDVAAHAERFGLVPDFAAKNASHIFAMPAARPHYAAIDLCGALLDVDAALRRVPEESPLPPMPTHVTRDDLATRITRARAYIAHCDGAIAGSGGHRTTFKVALALTRGFELPPEIALQILVEDYNPKCAPAWSLFELRHKVKSSAQRARVPSGWLLTNRRSA